jgi:putative FmdB family regulatory protein
LPRYEYYCSSCKKDTIIQHLSTESAEVCPVCQQGGHLIKKISTFRTFTKSKTTKRRVGDTTEEFIRTSRDELKQQKKEMDDKR